MVVVVVVVDCEAAITPKLTVSGIVFTYKAFLPHMAKEYGFEYELVQYHWPHWLHAQTEKQRVIWG